MYDNEYQGPGRSTEIVSQPRYELDSTIHKWMFSNEEVLKEVEKSLKGQIYNRDTRRWEQALNPLLNDDGINMIIYILKPYTSNIFSFSSFSEKDIMFIMLQFMEDLIPLLATEADTFGIDDNNLSMIKRIIEDAVFATLQKAKDGLSLGFLRDTQKTVETVGGNRGGGFSLWKMFGGRGK